VRPDPTTAATATRPATTAPLRAVAIGTGKISEEHLKFLNGPGAAAGASRLVGVCDLSPALAGFAAKRFGADDAYTDYADMLARAKPDVVHILTPPHTHVRLVGDCLAAGAHVIVEKPVAPTHAEFLSLWDASQRAGRRLVEDHNYRFNKPVLAIEQLAHDGSLGTVYEVDVRMALSVRGEGSRYMDACLPHPSHRLPCGVIHEFVSHLCYLALRFLPSVDRVGAAWSKHGSDTLFKHDDLDALVIGGPVHARLRFTSHSGPDAFEVTVRGSKGWAQTDLFQPHLRVVVPRPGGKQLSPLVNQFVTGVELTRASLRGFRNKVMQRTPYEGLGTFLVRTYAALQAGTEPPVTFADMDGVSRLIDALLATENQI
jgi:predicted dehydrogenase